MREVTIALAQFAPKLGEMEENLSRMAQWVENICLQQKTDLIVFPELATTGYECGVHFVDLAERLPGHSVNYLAKRASQYNVHLVWGMVEEGRPEGVIYDSAVMVSPEGELVARYQKVHLKGEERLTFRPGFRYVVIEAGFGNVGLLVGWDLAFPEAARSLALQGAELICVCGNWEKPHREEWRAYNYARALENSCFVAAANRVGEEYTYAFIGDSMLLGPRAETYIEIEDEREGFAVATVDLDEVGKYRDEFQLLQSRQPRSYREIVKMY